MKKSCFLISYQKYMSELGLEGVTDLAKKDGFTGIEPAPVGYLWGEGAIENAKRFREKLDKEGLVCPCFSYGISMLDNLDTSKDLLKLYVDIAKILGAPYLHHTMQCDSFNLATLPNYYDVKDTFLDISKAVAEYAGEQGLSCIYEDQGLLLNTPERMAEFLHELDLPNTGVCLDVGNALFYDIEPEAFTGAFASMIKHVHIKDYLRQPCDKQPGRGWSKTVNGNYLRGTIIGHGVVDFERIFTMLFNAGYDGWFSLEYEGKEETLSGVKTSMENLEFYYNRAKMAVDRLK